MQRAQNCHTAHRDAAPTEHPHLGRWRRSWVASGRHSGPFSAPTGPIRAQTAGFAPIAALAVNQVYTRGVMATRPSEDQNRHRRILGRAAAADDEAQEAAADARRLLVGAIAEAGAAGLSSREISDIVGLSHTTVAKMARLAREAV